MIQSGWYDDLETEVDGATQKESKMKIWECH